MGKRKRKAAIFYGVDDIRIEEIEMPKMGPNDVLIKVKAVGICGSDLHYYKEGKIGIHVPTKGHILGHECAGEIVEVGKEVEGKKVGDRVAIEPGVPCRKCKLCKEGRYNLCKNMMFRSHPPLCEGAFVEYLVSPTDFAYKIPDTMSYAEGAMLEPLAVGMQATKRGEIKAGDRVAILGCGPIGLSTLQATKARGTAEVYMTDLLEKRLTKAKELGASAAINVSIEGPEKAIQELTDGEGVNVVIEAAGSVKAYQQCTGLARRGGILVFVGMTAEMIFPLNVFDIIDKGLDIKGVFRYANVYPAGIALASTGKVNMKALITHRFPFDEIAKAMDFAYKQKKNLLKVVLNFK